MLSCRIMGPLWRARFHPVDDHEFAAMLSLNTQGPLTRWYQRFFEMSPARHFPDATHWRPAVWLARSFEAEFFGNSVSLYFLWRTVLLAFLGALAAEFIVVLLTTSKVRMPKGSRCALLCIIFGLMVISNPSFFDVFGRLLPGEMYTLIGILTWIVAWLKLVEVRTYDHPLHRRYISFGLLGLVLMVSGKEDAIFLWPLAIGLSLPEVQFLRRRGANFVVGAYVATGILWLAATYQIVRSVILGGAGLPYHDHSSSLLTQLFDLVGRIGWSWLALTFGSLLLVLLQIRSFPNGLNRVALFLAGTAFLELLYVSSVPVSAPRYKAVSSTAVLLFLALFFVCFVYGNAGWRRKKRVFRTLLPLPILILSLLGVAHQRKNNHLYKDISLEWNTTIEEVQDLVTSRGMDQILLIVDPPGESDIGRWEKSYSFAKFVRLATEGDVQIFMSIMSSDRLDVSRQAERDLTYSSNTGAEDLVGYIFRPRRELVNIPTLCVLYSNSGRAFGDADRCTIMLRLAL